MTRRSAKRQRPVSPGVICPGLIACQHRMIQNLTSHRHFLRRTRDMPMIRGDSWNLPQVARVSAYLKTVNRRT